jgi:hypothetical protein
MDKTITAISARLVESAARETSAYQEKIKDPLSRFFEREINTGVALLKTVQNDLNDVHF